MDEIHVIILTIGLFVLTFINPGANLLVVVQTSLSSGKNAGLLTGLGVALGDAIYSGLGLFGMAALIAEGGALFSAIKIGGGLYLVWYAYNMVRHRQELHMGMGAVATSSITPWYVFFRRGLLTDLSNPQTVLFFISIFSVTLTPTTPAWAKMVALARHCCGLNPLAVIAEYGILPPGSTPRVWQGSALVKRYYRSRCRSLWATLNL